MEKDATKDTDVIAIIIPSRGLVHSRTMEDVIRALKGYDYDLFMAHGFSIPDCFNVPTEQALLHNPTHLLFIEDDMQLPPDIIDELFFAKADIATADYPVRGNQHVVTYLNGKFAWGGLGCTLIKREVFDALEMPYFRTDTAYQVQDDKLIPTEAKANYGIFDVDFYQRTKDFSVKVIDMTAGQYFLKKPELPKYANDTAKQYEVELWEF